MKKTKGSADKPHMKSSMDYAAKGGKGAKASTPKMKGGGKVVTSRAKTWG